MATTKLIQGVTQRLAEIERQVAELLGIVVIETDTNGSEGMPEAN